MVNVHFKCRHISQFKGLIDVINYWKWKDKETAKIRKEIPIQFKIGTLFSYWVISGAVDLGFQLNLYGWKAKK